MLTQGSPELRDRGVARRRGHVLPSQWLRTSRCPLDTAEPLEFIRGDRLVVGGIGPHACHLPAQSCGGGDGGTRTRDFLLAKHGRDGAVTSGFASPAGHEHDSGKVESRKVRP